MGVRKVEVIGESGIGKVGVGGNWAFGNFANVTRDTCVVSSVARVQALFHVGVLFTQVQKNKKLIVLFGYLFDE